MTLGGTGFDFKGDFVTKGCYAYESGKYAGRIYYGTGGTKEEMSKLLIAPQYRPKGYDCSEGKS